MTIFSPGQKKSIRSEVCCRRLVIFLCVVAMFLTGTSAGAVTGAYAICGLRPGTAVMAQTPEGTGGDVAWQAVSEALSRDIANIRMAIRYEKGNEVRLTQAREFGARQYRLLIWFLLLGISGGLLLLWRYEKERQRKQKELLSRSRMIVGYMRRADGKKNGIYTS